MNSLRSWIQAHKTFVLSVGFLVVFSVSVSYAVPPTSPYAAGETLDPSCAPGEANCTVAAGGISNDGTILAVDTNSVGTPMPDLGAGTRLMWYPSTGAFRAGSVDADQWDTSNVGNYSAAFGTNNIASGGGSMAFGENNQALGNSSLAFGTGTIAAEGASTAFGGSTQATGYYSTAFGTSTLASGGGSLAFGNGTKATGYYSTAFGSGTTASGNQATAFGGTSTASGIYSTAFGTGTTASGNESTAFGNQAHALEYGSTAFGENTTASGVLSLAFGVNTTAAEGGSTAFGNGTQATGYYSTAFGTGTLASGGAALAFGGSTQATGYFAVASGSNTVAAGNTSAAFGTGTQALGGAAAAFGYNTIALGYDSAAFGLNTQANGDFSTAFGENTITTGSASAAFGYNTTAGSFASAAFGQYNIGGGTFDQWIATDPLFEIGNGDYTTPSNALTILKNGNTSIGGEIKATSLNILGITDSPIDAPTNAQASIAYDPGAYSYFNDGSMNPGYQVYSYKDLGGGARLYSTTSADVSISDNGANDGTYAVTVSWDPATGADGYRILTSKYGNPYDAGYDTTATSFVDGDYSMSFDSNNATVTSSTVYTNANTINGALSVSGNITAVGDITAKNGFFSDAIIATGTISSGTPVPDLGAGTRMMWIPSAGAFRAGSVNADQWDSTNVGQYSVAFSQGKASGYESFAFGDGTVATDYYSFAFGAGATASAYGAIALGNGGVASGNQSLVLGSGFSHATAQNSTAFGNSTTASGSNSTSFGSHTTASGDTSTAFGDSTTASNYFTTAFGYHTLAFGSNSTAFGNNTDAHNQNATAFGRSTTASGDSSTSFGDGTLASGHVSTAFGQNSQATGDNSIAFGFGAIASSDTATAFGASTLASGFNSTAFGRNTIASGNATTAFGSNATASGGFSTAFGQYTTAASANSTVFGRYNVGGGDPDNWIGTDSLFEIGNGADDLNHSNAFTVLKNGNATIGGSVQAASLNIIGSGVAVAAPTNFQAVAVQTEETDYLFDELNYRVYAYKTVGNGRIYSASYATLDAPVTSENFGQFFDVQLSWDPVDGADGYRVIADGGINNGWGFDTTDTTALDDFNTTTHFDANKNVVTPTTVFTNTNSINGATSVTGNLSLGGSIIAAGMTTPDSGPSSSVRMEWLPASGAFRAGGMYDESFWDSTDVGDFSAAFGLSTAASGFGSLAGGAYAIASGFNSTAFGYNATASGNYSTAFGSYTTAASYNSFVIGQSNVGGGDPANWVDTDSLFEIGNGNGSSLSNALTVLKNGNVGIKTATPGYLLTVGDETVTPGVLARFDANGAHCDLDVTITGGLNCSSDMTLKKNKTLIADNSPWTFNENISYDNQSVLNKVLALRPVSYNWNSESDTETKHAGFIAQEVREVFPDLITADAKSGTLSMNYTGLIPYTIQAIQDMNFNITKLDDLDRPNTWRESLIAWLGSTTNGIQNIFSKKVTTDQLCVGSTCVTEEQFLHMVQQSGTTTSSGGGTSGATNTQHDDSDQSGTNNDDTNTQTPATDDIVVSTPADEITPDPIVTQTPPAEIPATTDAPVTDSAAE